MTPSLLAVAVLAAMSPMKPPPNPPVKVVVLASDTLLVESTYPIQNAFLADHYERYSYFVDYSPDGCKARILLRTRRPTLRLVVEIGTSETGRRARHVIDTRNPRMR
jgi:hypothetical protein